MCEQILSYDLAQLALYQLHSSWQRSYIKCKKHHMQCFLSKFAPTFPKAKIELKGRLSTVDKSKNMINQLILVPKGLCRVFWKVDDMLGKVCEVLKRVLWMGQKHIFFKLKFNQWILSLQTFYIHVENLGKKNDTLYI